MKGSTKETLDCWVRICCNNWLFIHYPDKVQKLTTKEYRDNRNTMSDIVMDNLIYKEFEKTVPNDLFTNEEYKVRVDSSHTKMNLYFEKTEKVVFKILDAKDLQEQIKKDFE